MKRKRYFDLLRQAFGEFQRHKALRLGAALAYYTLFSIAPLPTSILIRSN